MLEIGLIGEFKKLLSFFEEKEHINWQFIKEAKDLNQVNGIIMFTENVSFLVDNLIKLDLIRDLKEKIKMGLPIWVMGASFLIFEQGKTYGRCSLELVDLEASKNYYPEKFTKKIYIPALGTEPIQGDFYQTPWIENIGNQLGVMAKNQGKIVMIRQGNILVSVFSPARGENRLLKYFLKMIKENMDEL